MTIRDPLFPKDDGTLGDVTDASMDAFNTELSVDERKGRLGRAINTAFGNGNLPDDIRREIREGSYRGEIIQDMRNGGSKE